MTCMHKESTKENIEFEFVYDALEELYISSESQGFEIRYVVQLLYQLIGVKILKSLITMNRLLTSLWAYQNILQINLMLEICLR